MRAGAELPDGLNDGVVRVRPWRADDEDWVFEVCSTDREISRWTRVPWPYGRAHARDFVVRAPVQWEAGTDATFVVTDAGTGERLGAIGIHRIAGEPKDDELPDEVGYWLAVNARGRGAATRALLLVSDWAFATLGRPTLWLQTKPENERSRRVAERAGYRPVSKVDRAGHEPHDDLAVYRRNAPAIS